MQIFAVSCHEWAKVLCYMPSYLNEREGNLSMASNTTLTPKEALDQVWKGNVEAQKHAEKEVLKCVNEWLFWFQTEWKEDFCPANGRFDFMVSWEGEGSLPVLGRGSFWERSCLGRGEGVFCR